MNRIDYNNRKFASVDSSENGEVSGETIFGYRHKGDLVTAEYAGGEIIFGSLIAIADKNGLLDMRYQHLNKRGELMTGVCRSTPEILDDGRIRLHEKWQWTSGDLSNGESIIEEIEVK